MAVSLAILVIILLMLAAVRPRRSNLSTFELERRRETGDDTAAEELQRQVLVGDILALRRVAVAVILVAIVPLAIGAFGTVVGIVVSVLVALFYAQAATRGPIRDIVSRLYERVEPGLLKFISHRPYIGKLFRSAGGDSLGGVSLGSREELEHAITESTGLLSADEKKRLMSTLHFSDKTVEDVMTPRGMIDSIDKGELIGPLTLDDLHRKGHSRFPVTDGDIDHVVGILHIKELLTLEKKDSQSAAEAMEKRVYYINQDQTLDHALAAFLKTRRHLFVVVNGYRETAGLVTLEDVIEELIGREIVDEFDVHDDLRVVAARNARDNNNPPSRTDV